MNAFEQFQLILAENNIDNYESAIDIFDNIERKTTIKFNYEVQFYKNNFVKLNKAGNVTNKIDKRANDFFIQSAKQYVQKLC